MNPRPETSPASKYKAYDHGDDSAAPLADPMARQAPEWGLASLMTGCMLTLGAVVFLHLAVVTRMIGENYFGRTDVIVITILVAVMGAAVLVLALTSLFAGVKAILAAQSRNQPIAFGLMGFLVSGFGLALWICTLIASFGVLNAIY